MVKSLNTKVDISVKGTSYLSIANYGNIMVGDKAFEFYNERNLKDYIQIPWEEVDCVLASVMFKGKWIPRFAIRTRQNGTYTFSSRDTKALLRSINQYIADDHMVHSLSFFAVLKRGVKNLFHRK